MFNHSFFNIYKLLIKNNKIINNKCKSKYLCSISGGQDSMFLFYLYLHLYKQWDFDLCLLNCNHLWQQNNFIQYKEIYKISYIFKISLYCSINENKIKKEISARHWRQYSFNRIMIIENCCNLLTGHTALDKIETAFFNIIRGTSPKGISSLKSEKKLKINFITNNFSKKNYKYLNFDHSKKIKNKLLNNKKYQLYIIKDIFPFINNFPYSLKFDNNQILKKKILLIIVISYIFFKKLKFYNILFRPLLFLHRYDIINFCKYYFIPVNCDFSNNNFDFSRNLIRHYFFKSFRIKLNKNFDVNFNKFLNILIEEQEILNIIFINFFLKNKIIKKNNFLLLSNALQRLYIFILLENYLLIKCTFNQLNNILLII
uniref:tRNA(Ile)-lysidine synthase n=1 Tax=Prototheca fontanea TaxID=2836215 RepID=UPI003002928C